MTGRYLNRVRGRLVATSVLVLFVFFAIASPESAIATTNLISTDEIQSWVDEYEKDVLSNFVANSTTSPSAPRRMAKSYPSPVAVPYDSSQWDELGLIPLSSDSNAELSSVTQNADGSYDIVANVVSNISFTIADDATLVIGGVSRRTLTESSVDVHSISANLNRNGELEMESDVLLAQEFDGSEQNGVLSNPMNSSILAGTSAANEFGTNSAGLNYIRAIKYAEEWASKSVVNGDNYNPANHDVMNPDFPIYQNNCTNFVSQVLYAGGLPLAGGNSFQTHDTSVWTWNLAGIAEASRTWSAANYNYTYMKDHSNSFAEVTNPMLAWQGSIIYADWTSDGELDHAMFVVGYLSHGDVATPVIDQMTTPRYDFLFTDSMAQAKSQYGDHITWKTLQYNYV